MGNTPYALTGVRTDVLPAARDREHAVGALLLTAFRAVG